MPPEPGEGQRAAELSCRASAARCRLSRLETAGPTVRTLPAARLMLPAALLRLAAQHCGVFLVAHNPEKRVWGISARGLLACWPLLGSILGCWLSVCFDVY